MDPKQEVQRVLNISDAKLRIVRGDRVEFHLDSGDVIDGTLDSLRSPSSATRRITSRTKTWSRWAGTTDDLVTFLNVAKARIADRSSEDPRVSVRILLSGDEEEQYYDLDVFDHEIHSQQSGDPGSKLKDIQVIVFEIGPTMSEALKVGATLSRVPSAPAVSLSLEGADRTLVNGLMEEFRPLIDARRPRIPALPTLVQMVLFGVAGFAYFSGFSRANWDFLPGGWVGTAVVLLAYLVGFIGVVYALTAGLKWLFPPVALTHPGQTPTAQQWRQRTARVVGPLALAILPWVLQRTFD